MTDTQWPRFEVFQQDRPERPHRNVGSVHAADAELALLNARDVFARRPNCVSLWVIPVDAIMSRTEQELADYTWRGGVEATDSQSELYYVFQKRNQRQSMTFVEHTGEVWAADPHQALGEAVVKYGAGGTTYVWWVCPERAILRSHVDDVESMFSPALEKSYRSPREYRVMSELLEARSTLRKGGQDQ